MKINFNRPLADLDGSPLDLTTMACQLCGRPKESRPATLRGVCADALVARYVDEQDSRSGRDLPGEEKMKRYALALKITAADEFDVTPEELALIRTLVAKMFGPRVMGPAWAMLDLREEK